MKMIKKLLLITLLSISVFGVEIVVDKTLKLKQNKNEPLKRDNKKEVVVDSDTSLMWQDDNRAKSIRKYWEDAKEYCKELKHAGYNDWYLPNICELESIVDVSKCSPAIKKGFKNVASSYYWSSLLDVLDSEYVWSIYFENGESSASNRNKYGRSYIRCVRMNNN